MSRRTLALIAMTALAGIAGPTVPAVAAPPSAALPVYDLPTGFAPEGIAIGDTPYAYLGSRLDGDIYRLSLRTGRGKVISQGPGTPSLGLKIDNRNRLFLAGGSGGDARVVDASNGKVLRSYQLRTGAAFINDVVLTGNAAWFTDSTNPLLFKVPLGKRGKLPAKAVPVPITGDMVYAEGNNANGITATPDGRGLIVVQSNTGKLFRTTYGGVTREIDLGGDAVPNGDGLWLRGTTLYVVQNRLNVIARIELNHAATRGTVVTRTSSPAFDVPTTIAEYGKRFYLPNARFTTTPTPTGFTVVGIPRP
ncbi:superoxide dismutase [Actinoplanes sp. TFC3]|uniref:superoxide dismutase n=1 Tax=Actinoplanes sp. TFC3 TaxID=1710355 RepID=UPI000832260A|nr:superoxide dismutase [Actinoplanes sp. TFC3]